MLLPGSVSQKIGHAKRQIGHAKRQIGLAANEDLKKERKKRKRNKEEEEEEAEGRTTPEDRWTELCISRAEGADRRRAPTNVKPSRGSSLASMEMRTCVGLAFSFSALRENWRLKRKGIKKKKRNKEGIKNGLKNYYLIRCQLFLSNKTYIPNTYFTFFEHWKILFKLWYQTHFFVLFTLKTYCSTTLFKPQFSHLFKQQFLKTITKRAQSM